KGEDFTALDIEADVVDSNGLAKSFGDVINAQKGGVVGHGHGVVKWLNNALVKVQLVADFRQN
ncbi:MAG: hypothetical protein ACOVKF_07580, partial [Limnohabitans sp.]